MKTNISFTLIFLSAILLSSCVGKRKVAKMNVELDKQKQAEISMQQKLTSLDNAGDDKNKKGEIDDNTAVNLKTKLTAEIAASKKRTDNINTTAATIKRGMKKKKYKNAIVFNTNGKAIINEKKEDVLFVDDLLKQQNFIKFNTATFFPPGGFNIPDEKLEMARAIFTPVIDSLIAFLKKHPQRKIMSNIVCYGYADEQPIKEKSELWDTLTRNLNDTNASRQLLNMELSRLRSEDIGGIMKSIFLQNINQFPDSSLTKMRFIKLGKGEDYPNKKISDYTTDDERRRIVVIFWNALPEALFEQMQTKN